MDENIQESEGLEGKTTCSDEDLLAESIEKTAGSEDGGGPKSLHAQRNGLRRLKSSSETQSAHGNADEEESQFSSVVTRIARVRSSVWDYFRIVEEGPSRFAVCNICSKKLKQSRAAGTGTLRHHLLVHERVKKRAESGGNQSTMDRFESKAGPSSLAYGNLNLPSEEQRERLVNWMVRRNISFAEVEDTSFREFVFCLNNGIKLMSRTCVRGDILKRYENVKPALMERLSRLSGGVCVSVDGWTSESQRRNYIAIVITFIERWERKSILLCMKSTESESHTGDVIANLVFNELKEFNIHTKIVAMASDNGSNMVAAWPILVDLCGKDGITLDLEMHARCVCHVINLVVRSFLKEIGANRFLSDEDLDSSCFDNQEVYSYAVNLVRYLTSYVHSSPKRLSKFKSHQRVTGRVLLPVTETVTRWNSTYLMLKRSLEIKAALSVVFVGESYGKDMYPVEATWRRVETVVSFLEPFYQISQELQGEKALTNAVPSYNEIFDHVEDWEESLGTRLRDTTTLERAMWLTGLEAAKGILSKYYSKTDSRLYSCVTFCDPRLRGYYWLDAKYENDWIEKAKSQVREVYTAKYALHSHTVTQLSGDRVEKGDSVQRAMRKRTHSNMNELSLYEDGYPAPIGADPLAWWKLHETEFPGIARMSLDMLAIPATTANVERVFSKAKLILTDGRSLLDADVAGKIASMGSWFRYLGIGK
jgi:hAT family C-terminal dimerisation region/BED zinc finger